MNNDHRGSNTDIGIRAARLACAAAAAWALATPAGADAALLTTPLPAGIPTGTSRADNLIVDFEFMFANPLREGGIFSFRLTTEGLDPGENVVVDLFSDLGGAGFLGTAYSGRFTELSANCRVGSSLCTALLDGQFSVGLRMTGGAALLTSYTVSAWMPKDPPAAINGAVPNAVPEPGTAPLIAAALALAALGIRRTARAN